MGLRVLARTIQCAADDPEVGLASDFVYRRGYAGNEVAILRVLVEDRPEDFAISLGRSWIILGERGVGDSHCRRNGDAAGWVVNWRAASWGLSNSATESQGHLGKQFGLSSAGRA